MNNFGKQLRFFRNQSEDPKTGKHLTQEFLANSLYEEMGIQYTGAAVSDWERGESKINADDRPLLLSLVKILKRYGGIKSSSEADQLLESGNYRALNQTEKADIFSSGTKIGTFPLVVPIIAKPQSYIHFLLGDQILKEIKESTHEAHEGPRPGWPRVIVSLIRKTTAHITTFDIFRTIVWLWIWVLAYLLVTPSLQWSHMTEKNILQTVILYTIGSLILPMIIGAMTHASRKEFWGNKELSHPLFLHLYAYLGSYTGFHVGYFIAILFTSVQNLLAAEPATWIEFLKLLLPIVIGYSGAQLIPYNLWLAYGRLNMRDGCVLFVFILLGPLWACFFLEFYKILISPLIGAIIILAAITLVLAYEARKAQKNKKPD